MTTPIFEENLESEIISAEIEKNLKSHLPEKYFMLVEEIIPFIIEYIQGDLTIEALNTLLSRELSPESQKQLSTINVPPIAITRSSVISFGDNNNIGDVGFRDFANRDIINISVAISNTQMPYFDQIDPRSLEDLESQGFIAPLRSREFIRKLQAYRLLIIQEANLTDALTLAQFLALTFVRQEVLNYSVLLWNRNAPFIDLRTVLQSYHDKPHIFIFSSLFDEQREHLASIYSSIQHYIIVITKDGKDKWSNFRNSTSVWIDLQDKELYTAKSLAYRIRTKLCQLSTDKRWYRFLGFMVPPYGLLIGNKPLLDIAQKFSTPQQCELFATFLYADFIEKRELHVDDTINDILRPDAQLQHWYMNTLSPKEQYIVLGLTFFNGLRETQFFAGFEEIVKKAWPHNTYALHDIDYDDIHRFHFHFFQFISIDDGTLRIESIDPQHCTILFSLLWDKHRIRILKAIPVLRDMVKESVKSHVSKSLPPLFKTYIYRDTFRQAVINTFTEIGSRRGGDIQEIIESLAKDANRGCQFVAVQTITAWLLTSSNQTDWYYRMLMSWFEGGAFGRIERDNLQATFMNCLITILQKQSNPDPLVPSLVELFERCFILLSQKKHRARYRNGLIPRLSLEQRYKLRKIYIKSAIYQDIHDALSEQMMYFDDNSKEEHARTFIIIKYWIVNYAEEFSSDYRIGLFLVRCILLVVFRHHDIYNDQYIQLLKLLFSAQSTSTSFRAVLLAMLRSYSPIDVKKMPLVEALLEIYLMYGNPLNQEGLVHSIALLCNQYNSPNALLPQLFTQWLIDETTPDKQVLAWSILIGRYKSHQQEESELDTIPNLNILEELYIQKVIPRQIYAMFPEKRGTMSVLFPYIINDYFVDRVAVHRMIRHYSNSQNLTVANLMQAINILFNLLDKRQKTIITTISCASFVFFIGMIIMANL